MLEIFSESYPVVFVKTCATWIGVFFIYATAKQTGERERAGVTILTSVSGQVISLYISLLSFIILIA